FTISGVTPEIFRSIWMAVMPFLVPPTLKSMSPKKSSMPWMSTMVIHRSPSVIRPQEMPATGALMGTPASISARVEPQMEAWGRAVGGQHLAHQAQGVGELVHAGDDRQQRPDRKSTR